MFDFFLCFSLWFDGLEFHFYYFLLIPSQLIKETKQNSTGRTVRPLLSGQVEIFISKLAAFAELLAMVKFRSQSALT